MNKTKTSHLTFSFYKWRKLGKTSSSFVVSLTCPNGANSLQRTTSTPAAEMSMILGCRQFCKLYDCIYSATKTASFSRSKYSLLRDMSKSWQRQAIDWIWRHPITNRHKNTANSQNSLGIQRVKKVVKKPAGPDSTIARLYPVKVHLFLTKPTHQHKSGSFTNKKKWYPWGVCQCFHAHCWITIEREASVAAHQNAVSMRYDFLPPLRIHQAADSSSAVVSFGFPNPSSDLNCADTSSIAAFNCAIFSFKFFRVFCTAQKFLSTTTTLKIVCQYQLTHYR